MKDADVHIEELRNFAMAHACRGEMSVHGIDHWDRVARNAELLKTEEVDVLVVKAFAYIHDVERENEDDDPCHGPRAARLVGKIRSSVLAFLNDREIEQLKTACRLHTSTWRTDDATVNACFDADRLDLGRVGILPSPDKMATREGARIASTLTSTSV